MKNDLKMLQWIKKDEKWKFVNINEWTENIQFIFNKKKKNISSLTANVYKNHIQFEFLDLNLKSKIFSVIQENDLNNLNENDLIEIAISRL